MTQQTNHFPVTGTKIKAPGWESALTLGLCPQQTRAYAPQTSLASLASTWIHYRQGGAWIIYLQWLTEQIFMITGSDNGHCAVNNRCLSLRWEGLDIFWSKVGTALLNAVSKHTKLLRLLNDCNKKKSCVTGKYSFQSNILSWKIGDIVLASAYSLNCN